MIELLRNLFFRDFWVKSVSLILAVLIWMTVAFIKEGASFRGLANQGAERTYFNIPVCVMSSAADVRGFKVNPTEVEVKVRGDVKKLETLQPERDIRALIDLTGIEAARGLRKRIEITTPAGVTLLEVTPVEADIIVPPKR